MTEDYYTPEQIKIIVESAGMTEMMLPPNGARPAGYRSAWPEFAQEFSDYIGAPKQNKNRMPRPSTRQMDEYAQVQDWIVKLAIYAKQKQIPHVPRTLVLGMLHWPTSGRRRYSWSKLSRILNCSHPTAKSWYMDGIEIITRISNSDSCQNKGGRSAFSNVAYINPHWNV